MTKKKSSTEREIDKALELAVNAVRKGLKQPDFAARLSDGARSRVSEVIPTGLSVIDHYVIGCGGLPVGRTSEWSGPEGAGKTAVAYLVGAGVQRIGGAFIYGDAEHSYDEERAATFGVDPDKAIIIQCDTLEQFGPAMILALGQMPGTFPVVAAYDSIGGTATDAEVAGDFSGDAMGRKASNVAKLVRGLTSMALKHRAHIMLINQIRRKVGLVFGDPIYTPGGDAPKHAASLRIRMYPGSKLEIGGARAGQMPTMTAIKNRHAVPHHAATVRFLYESGYDERWATVEHAKDMEILPEDAEPTNAAYEEAMGKLGWPTSPLYLRVAEAEAVEAEVADERS